MIQDLIRVSLNNLNEAESRGSVISIQLTNSLQLKRDEYTWSWSYLQSEFNTDDSKLLFEKYRSRIRHSNFVLVLLLSIIHSTIQVARAATSQLEYSYSTLYAPIFSSGVAVVLLVWSFDEKRFAKHLIVPMLTSGGIFILLLLEEYSALLIDCYRTSLCGPLRPRIGSATYLILLIYFLPLFKVRYVTIAFGLTVVIFEGLVTTLLLQMPPVKFLPDLGTYIFLNIVGIIKQFVDEITQRRAFLDLRSTIECKLRLKLEKEKEDKLLLTIIPKYFVASLKSTVREENAALHIKTKIPESRPRSFGSLYILSFENISILFADIVNFTPLTETLDVADLINTLNELFSGFDQVVEENNCIRIKILGDCYYCISGLPESSDPKDMMSGSNLSLNNNDSQHGQHAVNCVTTGLGIIETIRKIRGKLGVPLDMRIGVHTGYVHCGLLGLLKWQYDIWSRDVTIANILEQTGSAGRVHISEATRTLLGNKFEVEPAFTSMSHPFLHDMETYFVRNPTSFQDEPDGPRRYSTAVGNHLRRGSVGPVQKRVELMHKANSEPSIYRSPTPMESSIPEFNELKSKLVTELSAAIEHMAFSKREQWLVQSGINPFLLMYNQCDKEVPFLMENDPIFKHNLACALVLYVAIIFVAYCGFWPSEQSGQVSLKSYGIAIGSAVIMVFFFIVLYVAWHNFFKRKIKLGLSDEESSTDHPQSYLPWLSSSFEVLSNSFQDNFWIRTVLFLIISLCVLTWVTFASLSVTRTAMDNELAAVNRSKLPLATTTVLPERLSYSDGGAVNVTGFYNDYYVVIQPRVITYSFALSLVLVSVFMRTHYLLKFLLKGIALSIFAVFAHERWRTIPLLLWESRFVHDPIIQNWTSAYIDHILFLTFIFILLHLEDRQLEYFGRLDYLWKCKVAEEEEEAKTTEEANRFLLANILPQHIITKYSNGQSTNEVYQNVAIMFASIPNFTDFYSENDMNVKGLSCLKMLNEIINDFDTLLYKEKRFQRIEKIKMVGSTFMAAAGLQTARRASKSETLRIDDPTQNVVLLVKFAVSMMEKLDIINKDSLQDFQLRIGIDCGTVIAGIVGDKKPLYDVWGNTVNVASRMDTTGLLGRIQVTAECAEILVNENVPCERRGETIVKGKKEPLVTYFVITKCGKQQEITHL